MIVVLEELPQHPEGLHAQLAGRGDDDDARSVSGHELELIDQLHGRDEEGERLPGSGLGRAHQISTLE